MTDKIIECGTRGAGKSEQMRKKLGMTIEEYQIFTDKNSKLLEESIKQHEVRKRLDQLLWAMGMYDD